MVDHSNSSPVNSSPVPANESATLDHGLTICGLDELLGHRESGITHVLSILDPGMPKPKILEHYESLRHHRTLHFHDIAQPMAGAQAPSREHIAALLDYGRETIATLGADAHLLIHCHAGVSRSTAAAAILLAQHRPGAEEAVLRAVVQRRPIAIPNVRMIAYADALLERDGALIGALEALRRARLEGETASPSWLQLLGRGLRGR